MEQEQKTTQIQLGSKFVLYDLNRNRAIQLYSGFTIGRNEGNETFPKDSLISRVHAKFHIVGQAVYIEDLGSTNKTKVDGKEIAPQQKVRLSLGSEISVGNQRFRLQIDEGATAVEKLNSFFDLKTWKARNISLTIALFLYAWIVIRALLDTASCSSNGQLYSASMNGVKQVPILVILLSCIVFAHHRLSMNISNGFFKNFFTWAGAFFVFVVGAGFVLRSVESREKFSAVYFACLCIEKKVKSEENCFIWSDGKYEYGVTGAKISDLDPSLQGNFKSEMLKRFSASEPTNPTSSGGVLPSAASSPTGTPGVGLK